MLPECSQPRESTEAGAVPIDVTVGVRVSDEHEEAGLDVSQHREVGYRI